MEILEFKFSLKPIIYCAIIVPLFLIYPQKIHSQGKNDDIIFMEDLHDWIQSDRGEKHIKKSGFDRLLGFLYLSINPIKSLF